MAKITYEDKVALNSNAEIPAQNKVNDVDMNNIKNSVNQMGSFTLATATTNGDFKVTLVGTLATNDIVTVLFPVATNGASNARLSIDKGSNYKYVRNIAGGQLLASAIQSTMIQLYYDGTYFVVVNSIKDIGALAALVTADKSSIVNAINELSTYKVTRYEGGALDFNTIKDSSVRGCYNNTNAPSVDIGVLETLKYSNDWVLQRFTSIQSGAMWQRRFTSGTTWTSWSQKWDS